MATKGKSRWEDDEEDAAEEARRKAEKETRKKAKAEKDRLKAEQEAIAAAAAAAAETAAAGSDQPPTKRRRLDADATPPPAQQQQQQDSNAPLKLLRYVPPEIVPCAHVDRYEPLNRIEEGSYGVVSRARDRETGEVVALKKLKLERETDGFPITSLREIQTLMASKHPNVVNIREIVMGDTLKEYVPPPPPPPSLARLEAPPPPMCAVLGRRISHCSWIACS